MAVHRRGFRGTMQSVAAPVSFLCIWTLMKWTAPVANAQIIILEPPGLAARYNNSRIEGSTAAFGTPYYGQRLTGRVFFFDAEGCKDDEYTLPATEHKDALPSIIMVRRGACHFVNKAEVAEHKGAKALLVADSEGSMSTTNDVKKIIMADDGWGDAVKIPSILIGDTDANPMVQALRSGQDLVVELAWDIPKDFAVQMDLWMSPSISQSMKFVRDYAPYALLLKHKLDFRPHYWIMSLPGNFKDMCTDDTGHFCGLDPDWGGSTTGKDIMEETVRELCLWETTQMLDPEDDNSGFYSEPWWLYIRDLENDCHHNGNSTSTTLGEECSYRLMEQHGVNANQVRKCYEQNFESLLAHDLINKAWSPMALMINNWRYSGPLDPETVTRAVCSGFTEPPNACVDLYKAPQGQDEPVEYKEDFTGLILVIVLSSVGVFVGLAVGGCLFWKCVLPKLRSSMRYAVMDEVRREVQNIAERDDVSLRQETRPNRVSEESV